MSSQTTTTANDDYLAALRDSVTIKATPSVANSSQASASDNKMASTRKGAT